MNRRQFLTGASAIAASAALPTTPVLAIESIHAYGPNMISTWLFHHGKLYSITGEDNVIHWLDPRDVEIVTDFPPCAQWAAPAK